MRALAVRLLVLALAALLTPGFVEAAENLWHLAAAGHGAHASDAGPSHRPQDEEHGCTGTFHLCSCHPAPAWRIASGTRTAESLIPAGRRTAPPAGHRLDGYHTALLQPPRA